MSYLVDTNAWMGFFEARSDFGKDAKATMLEFQSDCFVSVASIWEASIKVGLGKLHLPYDLKADLPKILDDCGMQLLPVEFEDAVAVQELEPIHCDPFDRIQLVQAQRRGMEIISRDSVFDRYGLKRIW